MKKEYIVPEIEVIAFDDGDVLTLSVFNSAAVEGEEHFFNFNLGNYNNDNKPTVDSTDVKNIMNKTQN